MHRLGWGVVRDFIETHTGGEPSVIRIRIPGGLIGPTEEHQVLTQGKVFGDRAIIAVMAGPDGIPVDAIAHAERKTGMIRAHAFAQLLNQANALMTQDNGQGWRGMPSP